MKWTMALLLAALAFAPGCDLFKGDTIVAPNPRGALFFVSIEAFYVGGTPGSNGTVRVSCAPLQHPSCGPGICTYKLEVDGVSNGATLFGTTFSLVLPSDELPYVFMCEHEASGSRSDSASVIVL